VNPEVLNKETPLMPCSQIHLSPTPSKQQAAAAIFSFLPLLSLSLIPCRQQIHLSPSHTKEQAAAGIFSFLPLLSLSPKCWVEATEVQ
jgi:hypothetical protein